MKFALQRGVDLSQVGDIKAFLADQIKGFKAKKNVRGIPMQGAGNAHNGGRGGNNSNKFYAFHELDNDNE